MWWTDLPSPAELADASAGPAIHPDAEVHPTAILEGDVRVGPGSRICAHARIVGPVRIGAGVMVGDHAMVRGPTIIRDHVALGFATEVKASRIADDVRIGPQCFIADSIVEEAAYLGAQVRTSNHRLDGAHVSVMVDGRLVASGHEKLGAQIGARAALGIQCIVLPGRMVPADSLFGPRITIEKNLPPGRYRLAQSLACDPLEPPHTAKGIAA